MSDIYYRVIALSGDVVPLQDFDERDYDQTLWLRDFNGKPLRFATEEEAENNYFRQIHDASEALREIGEAFGSLTLPEDSRFIAQKLISHFSIRG